MSNTSGADHKGRPAATVIPEHHREPRTVTELSALCGFNSHILARAEDCAAASRLSEETLVRVTRHFLQTGQQRMAERVFDVLVQRIASWIREIYRSPAA